MTHQPRHFFVGKAQPQEPFSERIVQLGLKESPVADAIEYVKRVAEKEPLARNAARVRSSTARFVSIV